MYNLKETLLNTELVIEHIKNLSDYEILKYLEKFDKYTYDFDAVEPYLLNRGNLLLNIFVAKNTRSDSIIEKLYISTNNKALKGFCLINSTQFLSEEAILAAIVEDEIFAESILTSPDIEKRTLKSVTEKAAAILSSSKDKTEKEYWINILQFLLFKNKSEKTFLDYDPWGGPSGYVEYLWNLFLILPCSKETTEVLTYFLLDTLRETITIPHYYALGEPGEKYRDIRFPNWFKIEPIPFLDNLFAKWKEENDYEQQTRFHCGGTFGLRATLAQLVLREPPFWEFGEYFANSDDLALRIGYYRVFKPQSVEDIWLGYEKDRIHFLQAIVDGKNFHIADSEEFKKAFWKLYCQYEPGKDPSYLVKHLDYSLNPPGYLEEEDDMAEVNWGHDKKDGWFRKNFIDWFDKNEKQGNSYSVRKLLETATEQNSRQTELLERLNFLAYIVITLLVTILMLRKN